MLTEIASYHYRRASTLEKTNIRMAWDRKAAYMKRNKNARPKVVVQRGGVATRTTASTESGSEYKKRGQKSSLEDFRIDAGASRAGIKKVVLVPKK